MIFEKIGHLCDYILFDEAWAGFMKFHPLYAGRFAMGLNDLGPDARALSRRNRRTSSSRASRRPRKSTSRTAISKASGGASSIAASTKLFMLHASTSPFYPLFASLDVGAQMMKGRSGVVLWDDTIRLGIELRKKVRAIRREFEHKEKDPARRWFFDVFVPDRVAVAGRDGGAGARDRLGRGPDRRSRLRSPLLGARARRQLAWLQPCRARLRDHRSQQADAADARLRPRHRRICGFRHSGPRGRAISAREPRRAGEERSQFAAVSAHARRGIEQGRNAAQHPGRLQAAA